MGKRPTAEIIGQIKADYAAPVPVDDNGVAKNDYKCLSLEEDGTQCTKTIRQEGNKWDHLEDHSFMQHDINHRGKDLPQALYDKKHPKPKEVQNVSGFMTIEQANANIETHTDAVGTWLLSCGLPISLVDAPEFKDMLHVFQPNATVRSSATITRKTMPKQYKKSIEVTNQVSYHRYNG